MSLRVGKIRLLEPRYLIWAKCGEKKKKNKKKTTEYI